MMIRCKMVLPNTSLEHNSVFDNFDSDEGENFGFLELSVKAMFYICNVCRVYIEAVIRCSEKIGANQRVQISQGPWVRFSV